VLVNSTNSEHYIWGGQCHGWCLHKTADLNIVQEKMPPNTSEVRHYHKFAKQFFFVLEGTLSIEVDDNTTDVKMLEGFVIKKNTIHNVTNDSNRDVVFLVISVPTSVGDKTLA